MPGDDEVPGEEDAGEAVLVSGEVGLLSGEEVDDAERPTAGSPAAVGDGDAAAEGEEAAALVWARTREAEAEEAAMGGVEQGRWFGDRVGNEEEERRLGCEVGRGEREGCAVGSAGGAEGEEILEACQSLGDLGDQIRGEVGGCGGGRRGGTPPKVGRRGGAPPAVGRRRAAPPAVGRRHFRWRPNPNSPPAIPTPTTARLGCVSLYV